MEPLEFIHSVQVLRESREVVDGETEFSGYTQVYASVPCLIEPMGAVRQKTILGEFAGLKWHFSWGSQVLKDGDLITWMGNDYLLRISMNDQFRGDDSLIPPYQTGFLEEEILVRG